MKKLIKKSSTYHTVREANNQTAAIAHRRKFIETDALHESAMNELKKVYWHEKELLIAIPMLLSTARTFELVDALTLLIKHTREHVTLLENQFPEIMKVALESKKYA